MKGTALDLVRPKSGTFRRLWNSSNDFVIVPNTGLSNVQPIHITQYNLKL